MTADVRFVARTTEGDAHVLATERTRDRLRDTGLADTRRSVKEQDRALRHGAGLRFRRVRFLAVARGDDLGGDLLRPQLSHGQELQHAILHVLKTVVILLEDLAGTDKFEVIIRARAPRQLGNPLEIRADHLRFHGFATGALEAAELTLRFRTRILGELELGELFAELGDLLRLVVVAELFLNGLQLLAQEHLALSFAQLFLDLRLDVFLRFEQADLALHVHEHATQALFHRERLQ